jgi:hypothetical protein
MIRRKQGGEFLLIAQDDHARLSGWLAGHLGNARFAGPQPREETIRGIALHDCGWPLQDRAPTLNKQKLPLHVFETPLPLAVQVWSESARVAAEAGPWAGLLVSLHVFHLSAMGQKQDVTPLERYENRQDLFLLNRFQQEQIELEEELRTKLEMRTDLPLRLGLAKLGVDPQEDLLRFNFRLLQAMDRISLDLACSEHVFAALETVHPRPGEPPIDIKIAHPAAGQMTLDPWPFDVDVLENEMPCKRLPGGPYESEEAFREAYVAAPTEAFAVKVMPG